MDDPNTTTTTTNDAGARVPPAEPTTGYVPAPDAAAASNVASHESEDNKYVHPGDEKPAPAEEPEEEAGPIAHNGPLTLSTEQHAEAKSLLADLEDHVPKEGHGLWRRLARLLRHA